MPPIHSLKKFVCQKEQWFPAFSLENTNIAGKSVCMDFEWLHQYLITTTEANVKWNSLGTCSKTHVPNTVCMMGQELPRTLDAALTYPRVCKPNSASPGFGITRALGKKPIYLLLAPSCWTIHAHQALSYPCTPLLPCCSLPLWFFLPKQQFCSIVFKQSLEQKGLNWKTQTGGTYWSSAFCNSLHCSAICPC